MARPALAALRLASLLSLSLVPNPAASATFSVPLDDLVGLVDFVPSTGGSEAHFDFGQAFGSIQAAWIEVEATVRAREFDVCGTFFDPQPCVHVVQLLGFLSIMDDESSPIVGFVWSDGVSFSDDLQALEASGTAAAPFNNPLVGWDFLLDGQGNLTLFWNSLLGDPDRIILNVVEPSGEILSARLIIEATPIPEPSTHLLVAGGLIALARLQARARAELDREGGAR